MGLDFWSGAVAMMLIATVAAGFLTNGGRSTWFLEVLVLMVYGIFGLALYVMPPGT